LTEVLTLLCPGGGDITPAPRSLALPPLTVGIEVPEPAALGASVGLWGGTFCPLPSLLFLPKRNDMVAPL